MSEQRRSQGVSAEETITLVNIGNRIRELRKARNLHIEEFAALAGIHRTHIWKIEKGQLNAGIVSYHRIARQLGVPLGALFSENDTPERESGAPVSVAPGQEEALSGV